MFLKNFGQSHFSNYLGIITQIKKETKESSMQNSLLSKKFPTILQ